MSRFQGKVALVTGGASGIGAATARRLAAEGARVILADRDATGLEQTVEKLGADGLNAVGVACDQTDEVAVARLFDRAVADAGRLDICFANAGYGRYGSFLEVSVAEFRRHLEVNLTGTFLVCQAAARVMVEARRGGAIILNASSAAQFSTALFSAYGIAKAGVGMMARCMADELGVHRIRVNAVLPGVIETPMTRSILEDGPEVRAMVEAETPMGRVGGPEDVAGAVAYLASDDAEWVTGTTLLVDGGQTIHSTPRWFSTDNRLAHEPAWMPHATRPTPA